MKPRSLLLPLLAAVALLLAPSPVSAENGYESHTWQPVQDGSGAFTTVGVQSLEPGTIRLGLSYDYARNPVTLKAAGSSSSFGVIIDQASTFEASAFFGLGAGLELGLAVPVATNTYVNPIGVDRNHGTAASGIGDLRAVGKWQALAPRNYLPGVAVIGVVTVPTGDGRSWMGSNQATPTLLVAGEERLGPVGLFGNAGYRVRSSTEIWGNTEDDDVLWRAGATWDIGRTRVALIGEAFGAIDIAGGASPSEFGFGVRKSLEPVEIAAGVNWGISRDIGSPEWRAYTMLSWTMARPHRRVVPVLPLAEVTEATPAPVEPEVEPEAITEIPQIAFFAFNSAEILPESRADLDAVARVLVAHPELGRIRVEGHTDPSGTERFNLGLSLRRAQAAAAYLVACGVPADRLVPVGYGEREPLFSNETAEGRAANRRVEFTILGQVPVALRI